MLMHTMWRARPQHVGAIQPDRLDRLMEAFAMTTEFVQWLVVVALGAAAEDALPAPPIETAAPQEAAARGPAAGRFEHFITRRDHSLFDGDRPFRFFGANMPGLVLPYDWTLFLPERMRLPTFWEQEDGLRTLDQMNLRVVRTWNLPIRRPDEPAQCWHYVLAPGEFNEEAFQATDRLLLLANRYAVRVVFDLTAEAGDYLGGIGTYAAHRGKRRTEFYTDPQIKDDYKATVRYVLGRMNRLTGVRYRDDKAILAWQFGNEMNGAPPDWLREMAAYIKSLDPNHLVADARHRSGAPLLDDPNIDLYTRHYYGGTPAGWLASVRRETAALKGRRPFFVGEFGPYIDGTNLTRENVVDRLREFVEGIEATDGVSGALVWSMYFHRAEGGFHWHQIMTYPAVWSYHWPGFASAEAQREIGILALLREGGFRIQGLELTPVPVPEPPELLPFDDVPMFSWRGSTGAAGYDIQRAAAPGGPWQTVARNVSDADVAYRPLWSDTTARPGQTWYYRVTARNGAGSSAPSNVVGPVRVRRICLVDELQDFAVARSRSPALQLDNDYNAVYAEYLFRARGAAGDWLLYDADGAIESVRMVSFVADEASGLSLHVSPDGKTFAETPCHVERRRLPSPPGGAARGRRRTLVEATGSVAPGNRFVKLEWTGPAELDRVEIFIGGRPDP